VFKMTEAQAKLMFRSMMQIYVLEFAKMMRAMDKIGFQDNELLVFGKMFGICLKPSFTSMVKASPQLLRLYSGFILGSMETKRNIFNAWKDVMSAENMKDWVQDSMRVIEISAAYYKGEALKDQRSFQ
jgi:hypothetical protein